MFSSNANERLTVGDELDVLAPAGAFTLTPDARDAKHYVGVAAGSGITPIISMLASALLVEPHSRFTLLYGNFSPASTMFADELTMLTRSFEGRLRIVHFYDGDVGAATPEASGHQEVRAGTIDTEALTELLTDRLRPDAVDDWFLCGPQPMTEAVRGLLSEHGVPETTVHFELFKVDAARRHASTPSTATVALRGQRGDVRITGTETVLEAALRAGLDAPYSCMGGACGTCRAKLTRGRVEMDQNYALSAEQLTAGYVLTCQSHPTTDTVTVDYDG